jgi:hypothetical protein
VVAGWLAAGTLLYQASYPRWFTQTNPGELPPAFQPAIDALDVLLPVVDLGQQTAWTPNGVARWFTWASILAGWVLTTAVVAALSGLLKGDR